MSLTTLLFLKPRKIRATFRKREPSDRNEPEHHPDYKSLEQGLNAHKFHQQPFLSLHFRLPSLTRKTNFNRSYLTRFSTDFGVLGVHAKLSTLSTQKYKIFADLSSQSRGNEC